MMNLLRENTTAVNMTTYSINKAEHVNTKQKQKQKQKPQDDTMDTLPPW